MVRADSLSAELSTVLGRSSSVFTSRWTTQGTLYSMSSFSLGDTLWKPHLMRKRLLLPVGVVLAPMVGLLAELLWVVHRQLPSLEELDASGVLDPGGTQHPPLRLVVMGDSSLTGPGLTHADEIWLRQALREVDIGRPTEIVSFAAGGSRVCDVRRAVDRAIADGGDIAVVAGGSNDAIHGTVTSQFERDLDGALQRLLECFTVVAIANVGDLGNIARVPPPLDQVLRRRSRAICRAIERVAARHPGAVLIDVTPADSSFKDPAIFADDLFHPGPVGHSVWAAAAAPALKEAVARASAQASRIESAAG